LTPDLFGEGGKGQQLGAGGVELFGAVGQFVGQRVKEPVLLGDNRLGVGLVEDGMQQGSHQGHDDFGVTDIKLVV
jgi:hypothetical protein